MNGQVRDFTSRCPVLSNFVFIDVLRVIVFGVHEAHMFFRLAIRSADLCRTRFCDAADCLLFFDNSEILRMRHGQPGY